MEEEAGTDDLRVVAHEYGTLGQETGQVAEGKFLDLASLVAEELGAAAVGKGVLGDAFVGQGVVVVGYLDLLGSYIHLTLLGGEISLMWVAQKYAKAPQVPLPRTVAPTAEGQIEGIPNHSAS